MQRFLILSLLTLFAATPAYSFFGLFGGKDSYGTIAEQNEKASVLWEKAQEAEAEDKNSRARSHYEEIGKKYPGSSYAAESLYRAGNLYLEDNKKARAFSTFQKIIDDHPSFERFDEVIGNQFDIASELQKQRKKKVLGVFPASTERDAIRFYESVVKNAPYSDLAPIALMNVALLHNKRGDHELAIDALDRLINDYPNSFLTSDAYLKLGETFDGMVDGPYYDQGSTREAIGYYRDYLILYPDNPDAPLAEQGLAKNEDTLARSRLILGEYYLQHRKNTKAARTLLNETITLSPESPSADRARQLIAEIDEYPEGYTPPSPSIMDNLMFWRGKEAEVPQAEPLSIATGDEQGTVAGSIETQRKMEEDSEDVDRGWFSGLFKRDKNKAKTKSDDTKSPAKAE